MDEHRARALVAESAVVSRRPLRELAVEDQAEDASRFDQAGESGEAGTEIQHEMTDQAVAASLRG